MTDECPVCGYSEWKPDEEDATITVCGHCGYEKADKETEWICGECGEAIKVGEAIMDAAFGHMTSRGPNLGDHEVMHVDCPSDEE